MLRFWALRAKHLAVFALPLAAIGCGGGGGTANFNTPPLASVGTPNICTPNSGATVGLTYPSPGALNAPTSLSQVVVAATGAVQSSGYLILVPNGASPTNGNVDYGQVAVLAPQSLPAGSTPANFFNPIYYRSLNRSSATLPGNTDISVYFGDSAANCVPLLVVGGSFKTQ